MLSDESSSDSETGRFKCQTKNHDERSDSNRHKRGSSYSRSSGRSRREDDRLNKHIDRKKDEKNRFERHSRERQRFSRYSPIRRRHSRETSRNRRSPEKHKDRHVLDSISKPKQRRTRSSSRDRYRCSVSKSFKSPTRARNIRDEIKGIITGKEKFLNIIDKKQKYKKSPSPEVPVKKSVVHKPSAEVIKKINDSPIIIQEHEDNDDIIHPGSYYSMIPAIVKDKSEESSEIDSSDDERLRAKLLNLEKELQKTKKKKHKKKHKRKSIKTDKGKQDSSASVEVSSTTDIQEIKSDGHINVIENAEVTSTHKSNQKESSEEGEILSDDNSQDDIKIDPTDLRHKLKRAKTVDDVCGPALPPHLEKRYRNSSSPVAEGPLLHSTKRSQNIGPSIPEDMRKVLASKVIEYESSEDDGIGPLPAGAEHKWSEAHTRLEERAMEMKIKSLDGHSLQNSNIKSRERWMLELPEGKAKYLGLEARSFRAKEGPDMSDRSSWTDTPEEKARKALGIEKEEDASDLLQKEARMRHIANRDDDQEKAVKKHKKKHKREESLLEIHQKKLKKKKKKEDRDDEKKDRRPFSRDVDLQVNRFDEAQKKSIIKKAQGLNSRFSSGEAKYL